MSNELLVQKFGGTSLADLKGFNASADVIESYAPPRAAVIVVLSAVKGVTDLLLSAIDTAVEGGNGAQYLEQAIDSERSIIDELSKQGISTPLASEFLEEQQSTLTRRVEGIRCSDNAPTRPGPESWPAAKASAAV